MASRKSKLVMLVTAIIVVCLVLLDVHLAQCHPHHDQPPDQQSQCSYRLSLTNSERFQIKDEYFTASSSYPGYSPENARYLTELDSCWCSDYLGTNSVDGLQAGEEGPWFEVQFGATVIIDRLYTSGYNADKISSFVSEFNIYFGNVDDELEPITVTTEGPDGNTVESIKKFTASTYSVKLQQLDDSIVTQRLHIKPLKWKYYGYACMSIAAFGCLQEGPICGVNEEPISADRSLLPMSGITANDAITTIGDRQQHYLVDNTGGYYSYINYLPWCFDTNFNDNPYVELEFTEPIWLTHIITRRHPLSSLSESKGYIKRISFQYNEDNSDSFTEYSDLFGQYIIADNGVQLKTFWEPVVGTVFRLYINDGKPADGTQQTYCWNIQLYGCTAQQEFDASSQLLEDNSKATVGKQVGILIGCVLGFIILTVLVIIVVGAVIKWRERSREDNENGSSEWRRDRSFTTTIIESLVYMWAIKKSDTNTSTANTSISMQSGNELQILPRSGDPVPLSEPLIEECNSEDKNSKQ